MLSDSTLLFSKMPHPTVKTHTFHQSAANGLCNILISCNLYYHFENGSVESDSMDRSNVNETADQLI